MQGSFDSFVIFAEMRTGSNFLEANLNSIDGIKCHGEAFNPYFIGYPSKDELLGVTQADRDADPLGLLKKIKASGGMSGFRYFHDHDPRVLTPLIDDRGCAKIILQRNPVESFVSWKIAQSTGQWKLTDVARRRDAKMTFDPAEFAQFLNELQTFQSDLRRRLQKTGQAAFELRYDDLQSVDVINGLASFLDVDGRLEKLDKSLKVQNPAPLSEKVSNADVLTKIMNDASVLDVRTPTVLEPERMAAVTTYMTGAHAPLVYLPIRGGPDRAVSQWLADLDDVSVNDLPTGLSQKDLRQWKRANPRHRSFTVVRHPVSRAHHAYCSFILGQGPTEYVAIRQNLSRLTDGVIPFEQPDDSYDLAAHRAGFVCFLDFLSANLNGQSAIRVDAAWSQQAQIIAGFARFAPLDFIFRENDLKGDLPDLASRVGYSAKTPPEPDPDGPHRLEEIYDEDIERAARKVYQRDYMTFGFESWA